MKNDPRFQPVDASLTPRFSGIATFMRTQRHRALPDLQRRRTQKDFRL
jgi:guanidinopropionase